MTTHTTAATALDLSSLARFSDAGLVACLQDRRARARAAAAAHGRNSVQHRGCLASVHAAVTSLQSRGLQVPAWDGRPNTTRQLLHDSRFDSYRRAIAAGY